MPFGVPFSESERQIAGSGPRGNGLNAPSFDLQHVTSENITVCAEGLRAATDGTTSREDAAGRITQHLFHSFHSGEDRAPACALVRCFLTCSMAKLPAGRRAFAMRHLGSVPYRENMRCLTLLATRGTEPQWNRVEDSAGHQAIPLPSVEVILRAPMIARLLLQMGVRYEHVVSPPEGGDFMVGPANEALKVFHVARARGSQYIPAQASFVHRFGIRSVLGLGGLLPSGDLAAIVMFSRAQVSREAAEHFRTLAEAVRAALVRLPAEQTFASSDVPASFR